MYRMSNEMAVVDEGIGHYMAKMSDMSCFCVDELRGISVIIVHRLLVYFYF